MGLNFHYCTGLKPDQMFEGGNTVVEKTKNKKIQSMALIEDSYGLDG